MVSGTTIKPGIFALRYIGQQGGNPEAQVVGSGIVTSAINAALANGMLAHSDETDDSNGSAGIHPGCAVIPLPSRWRSGKTPAVRPSCGR